MPYSIELFFDPRADMAVRQCGISLEKQGVQAIFSTLGSSPHITLSVFESYDSRRLHSVIKRTASSFPPLPFRLSSLGTFPGREGVLFLAPVVTAPLLEMHGYLHRLISRVVGGSWDYYSPAQWVPHCTLAMRLTPRKFSKGLDAVRRAKIPVAGFYSQVALVETHPVRIQPIRLIYSIPFSGKKK